MTVARIFRLFTCGTALTLALGAGEAYAQIEAQTGSADPGRASEQFRDHLSIPQLGPDIQVKQTGLIGAPEGAENIKFRFGGLQVDGNDVYKPSALAPIYQDKIGQEISLADLYRMANDITLKYRNDGYVLTQVVVPPQTIESGLPRVQVVEGYIDQVQVQAGDGEGEIALDTIRRYAAQINNGKALNIKDMERQLLLINDLPGVRARSVISPSTTTPGAADLLIIVERKPYDAMLTADNFGSRYLGEWQFGGAGTLNSLLGMNEAISAQVAYAPGTGYELIYGGVGYEQPIGPWGTRLGAFVSKTNTDPGYDLEQFDVRGKADLYSINVTHPFIRTRNENLKGRFAFDWRDVKNSNNIEPDARKDEIRALRTGLQYDFLDTLMGLAFNSLDLEISKGLSIFGASEKGDDNMSRPDGDPQFTKAELEVQRLQRLTNSVNLQLTGKGQLSNGALLSSEEFGVGGVYSGRGYDPSEIVGDEGVSGQVELQWNNPITLDTNAVDKVQFYTFFDIGRVWNDDATTNDDKRESLASTGVGARVNFANDIQAGLGVAFPLTRRVESDDERDPRLYLNVSKKF